MIVADTNLIGYLLIPGPFTIAAQRAFDRDNQWIAPSIWQHEFLNVLSTSVRAGFLTQDKAMALFVYARTIVKTTEVLPLKVLAVSVAAKFATYDCYFVVLARALGTRIVTADKRLLAEFPDAAISIEDFAAGR